MCGQFKLVCHSFRLSEVDERIVVMSIHQPRYSIFKLFDGLTLLSHGKIVYHGGSKYSLKYFEKIGKQKNYAIRYTLK